ncbi:MAG TPA: helix-turn-helix domain-containing protein [Armatimonadota bacterium]|nr:helix-turn-helix domain-containing protein [Armatimonadota bacterium]
MADPAVRNSLRVQRAIHDLTQAELAERAGITRASVNAIEGGRMIPSVLLALKLARALGVSVDDLFALAAEETAGNDPVRPDRVL